MTNPATPALGAERLRILADTLSKAVEAGHYTLNMHQWVGDSLGLADPNRCGTAGCAIGFCPVAFPDHWRYSLTDSRKPELNNSPSWHDPFYDAEEFFGLDSAACRRLFSSYSYDELNQTLVMEVVERIRDQAANMERHS